MWHEVELYGGHGQPLGLQPQRRDQHAETDAQGKDQVEVGEGDEVGDDKGVW